MLSILARRTRKHLPKIVLAAALSISSSSSTTIARAMSSALSESPKRRLLFLHGMFIPPEYYQEKIAPKLFRALEHDRWECTLVKSPRPCADPVPPILYDMFPDMKDKKDHPEWLNAQTNDDGTKTYQGLEDSLAFLQAYLTSQPRFDVIAGHSNGALMASILAFKMESDASWLSKDKHCRAVLLCNGPASYETETTLSEMIQQHGTPAVQTPSIHVWGGPC